MELSSSAFEQLGVIPRRHTCEGEDVAPPLRWSGVPVAARSLALIVDDPDAPYPAAPMRTWVHWVVVDLPGDARPRAGTGRTGRHLREGAPMRVS